MTADRATARKTGKVGGPDGRIDLNVGSRRDRALLATGTPPAGDPDILPFSPFVVDSSWYDAYWYQRIPVRRSLISQVTALCAKVALYAEIAWRRLAGAIAGRERLPTIVTNTSPAE